MGLSDKSTFPSWIFRKRYYFIFSLIILGYILNLNIDIMEIDAAQYASISREMAETGSYLQVYQRGHDYLDKPPLLFWLSSLGISLLGNTSLAYKIIPVLFLVIALWATYRFASLWYDHRTGILSALILGTTQAFNLMSNDVRTDGLLTAFVMLAVWQLSLNLKDKNKTALFIGGICIGGAMLAKGPVGLFIPAAALGGHLLMSGQWRKILDPWWLVLVPVIAIVLAPMCYGLYMQFDLHPEKEVYGLKGPSGLGFYFWTQSFGRITGSSHWSNSTPWYFFLQSMLWDLQPWVLFFIPALWTRIKNGFKKSLVEKPVTEWITISGFLLPFIALSFSGYKLPHYIFPLFPFAAVMIAAFLVHAVKQLPGWLEVIQLGVIHLLLLASLLIMFWVFPVKSVWLVLLWISMYTAIWWWRSVAEDKTDKWVLPSLTGILLFQFILGLHFYPQLLQYQSGSQAGKFIAREKPERVYWHDRYAYSLDYYSGRMIPNAYGPPVDTLAPGSWIFVSESALPTMPSNRIIREFDEYPVSRLSTGFFDPEKRKQKVKKMYVVEVKEKE